MERVLCVDDDPRILQGLHRRLRKRFDLRVATGPEEGLEAVASEGPFAVVVSDMRMPGMDGVQFLGRVQESAPDTVRVMLTGNTDLQTAMEAVNEGNVYRFLTKPCEPEDLARTIDAGIAQYRLIVSEREILEKTLHGAVDVLGQILSMADPRSFARAQRVSELAAELAGELAFDRVWEIKVAASLAQIGHVTVPHLGGRNEGARREMLRGIPEIGRDLLLQIPRLDGVAQIVYYQRKNFDGSGFPEDERSGVAIPKGARILRILYDLVEFEESERSRGRALGRLAEREGVYDPELLAQVTDHLRAREGAPAREVELSTTAMEMQGGDVVLHEVKSSTGQLLLAAHTRITRTVLLRLRNWAQATGIEEPVKIRRTVTCGAHPVAPEGG